MWPLPRCGPSVQLDRGERRAHKGPREMVIETINQPTLNRTKPRESTSTKRQIAFGFVGLSLFFWLFVGFFCFFNFFGGEQ